MDIVGIIGKIPFVKPILRKVFRKQYEDRVRKSAERGKRVFKENCLEALGQFHRCMEEKGYRYTAAFGTMLGAIREHGFIKHDLDIDFWMWIQDDSAELVSLLKTYGFKLSAHYSIAQDRLGKEYTFSYKGCNVDIFFIYPAVDKLPYSTCYKSEIQGRKEIYIPMRLELPVSKNRRLEKFEDMQVYVPENAEELCAMRYGQDYMTPKLDWDWHIAHESVVEWYEQVNHTKVKHY